MSCCAPNRGTVSLVPVPDSIAPGTGVTAEKIHFPATKSFVGIDHPVLPQDGEGPRRPVSLKPFSLETTTVTNARFAAFIAATGYVTEAERIGWSPVFRGLLGTSAPPPSHTATPWWVIVEGAYWAAPEGPGSSIAERTEHPVVQVSWADAQAYARWCGGRLPSEAEWEHAARGGLPDPRFPWGDAEPTDSVIHANIWQGHFPDHNSLADGYFGTSPVTAFPANGAGMFAMAGNVWEWSADAFRVRSLSRDAKRRNEHAATTGEKLAKGGSFLCHISYCYRYRIAARMGLTADSCASNVGFRVAYDA
ncbi:MAG TPA: formylglycine-generating enzyme family protein [Devosia sp.]|nr:formylglycine-generating enzyme family protein [Devosia sp.]